MKAMRVSRKYDKIYIRKNIGWNLKRNTKDILHYESVQKNQKENGSITYVSHGGITPYTKQV